MGGKGNVRATRVVNSPFNHGKHFETLFEPRILGFTLKITYLLVFIPAKTSADPGENRKGGVQGRSPQQTGVEGAEPHT